MSERKSIVVSTEDINSYGTWVRTDGIDLSNFRKNPVMLYNHERYASGGYKLPYGRWENLRVEEGKLLADPIFDEKDPFAVQMKTKFDAGILNAASIGIRVTEWSDEEPLVKKGQSNMTVKACQLREISLVDIPSNANAIALYEDGDTMLLGGDLAKSETSAIVPKINQKDIPVMFNKEVLLALGLPPDATQQQVESAIQLNVANSKAQADKMAELEQQQKQDKAERLIDDAIAQGKLPLGDREHLLKLALGDYETTKAFLDKKTAYKSPQSIINAQGGGDGGKSVNLVEEYDRLDKAGELVALSKKDPALFNDLRSAKIAHIRGSVFFEK